MFYKCKYTVLIINIYFLFCFGNDVAHISGQELNLDDNLKILAIKLFNESNNRTFVNAIMQFDDSSRLVADIYKKYTLQQLTLLDNELRQHEHFIYEPIKAKALELRDNFTRSCVHYDETLNIISLENDFLKFGEQIVQLQKLILRIINSDLEHKISNLATSPLLFNIKNDFPVERTNNSLDIFDHFGQLFFGISRRLFPAPIIGPINQLWNLMDQLSVFVKTFPSTIKNRFNEIKKTLRHLRYIYYVYRMGSYSNRLLNTIHIKPFSYQATLKLVDLIGYRRFSNPLINPLLRQIRFWINLFMGNFRWNQFTGTKNNVIRNKNDPELIQTLLKTLKEHEQRQRDTIERNRLNSMLEGLIKTQHQQQESIDKILKILDNNHLNSGTTGSTGEQTAPLIQSPSTSNTQSIPAPSSASNENTWTRPNPGPVPLQGGETLKQLKKQRQLLSELLSELQKPGNSNGNKTKNNPPETTGNDPPSVVSGPSTSMEIPNNGQQRDRDLIRAQNSLMTIMQNLTPLIGTMAQQSLVSRPTVQKSRFDIVSIMDSLNHNRELFLNSNESSLSIFQRLARKLMNVFDLLIKEIIVQ